jgi:hypothetical protein
MLWAESLTLSVRVQLVLQNRRDGLGGPFASARKRGATTRSGQPYVKVSRMLGSVKQLGRFCLLLVVHLSALDVIPWNRPSIIFCSACEHSSSVMGGDPEGRTL